MKRKINRLIFPSAAAIFVALTGIILSCKETKKSDDIIITKPVVEKERPTQSMEAYSHTDTVTMGGATYIITTERKPDTSLPLTKDETGDKYYDNVVKLVITRAKGSVVYSRTFTKNDFSTYIESDYLSRNALLAVVYYDVDGTSLCFAGSVGSPDKMSDDYIPLTIKISTATWRANITRDNNLGMIEEE